MTTLGAWCRRLLFPPKCAACGALLDWDMPLTEQTALCETCRRRWESEKADTCDVCAMRVTACVCMTKAMQKAKCAGFRKTVFYHHGNRTHVQNRLIFSIKTNNARQTPRFLAAELLPMLEEMIAEKEGVVLTYVPRSRAAKLRYGTDQARRLAEELSALSGLACKTLLVRTGRQSKEQKSLSPTARMRNAEAVYAISRNADVAGKCVVLVDDIVTTGATVAACVRLLRRAGASEVFCLAVATDDANKNAVDKK